MRVFLSLHTFVKYSIWNDFWHDYALTVHHFSNLSIDNYDSILIGWSKQNVQRNVELGASGINYCKSWFERFKLWFYFNWSFSDAGLTNYGCYFSFFTASKHDQNKTLSIDDPKNQLDISMYPNPTNDKLFIQGLSSLSKVSIYNVLGKLVLTQTISKEIDVKQLSKGIYILKIIDEQKETTRKFIKY